MMVAVLPESVAAMWEMRNLSDTYIQYKNLGAFTINCTDETPYLKMSGEYKDFDIISNIKTDDPLLVGCFDKNDGNGHAFTLVNMIDFKYNRAANVKFKLTENRTVTLYSNKSPIVLTPDADGYYTVTLERGQGVFITLA